MNVSGLLPFAESLFSPPLGRTPSLAVAPEAVLYNGCGSATFLEPLVFAICAVLALNDQSCSCHLFISAVMMLN